MKKQTPLMQQYWDIKTAHPDKILLFRMGDFFEMFFEDAVQAAPILGIALTSRNKKAQDETPMCGVPYHSISGPINKLLSRGFKVAICDQIEDAKFAKGLVKRAITRILTPGMVYDPETLEQTQSHYMVAWDGESLSACDLSTGECFYYQNQSMETYQKIVDLLPIAEWVTRSENYSESNSGSSSGSSAATSETRGRYLLKIPPSVARSYYDGGGIGGGSGIGNGSGSGSGDSGKSGERGENGEPKQDLPVSARMLLSYIQSLSSGPEIFQTLQPFQERNVQQRLSLSPTVLRHLEVFSNYRGEPQGSLFHSILRTQTSAGARRLRSWMSFPLKDRERIEERQAEVQKWVQRWAERKSQEGGGSLKQIRQILSKMGDIERRWGKISQPQCNARDLLSLAQSIEVGLEALCIRSLEEPFQYQTPLQQLRSDIQAILVEDPPLLTKNGNLIRRGVDKDLDEWIDLSMHSHNRVQELERRERELTQISSLKIRYNNVFGYYIEITHTHRDKVPSHYMRKQTLTQAERYYTEELMELEKKVLSAQSRRSELEYELFFQLRKRVLSHSTEILELAKACSELDVYTSLAWLAIENNYTCPKMIEKGDLILEASRHPVIEQFEKKSFVPNTVHLSQGGVLLLTGPNMAGKSTLMRQVALSIILAQMGSFVPARSAQIPLFDQIFTRIGASDMLTEGLSTFMVEMTETAEMLQRATSESLLILDEIGRGTSTYDGMSLAESILEYILTRMGAMTLFATHYHELTRLDQLHPQMRNAHMTVHDASVLSGEIRFLHTLANGPATKSYGIQVAQRAGLPSLITDRAKQILVRMESNGGGLSADRMEQADRVEQADRMDRTDRVEQADGMDDPRTLQILQQLQSFPLHEKTPLEGLIAIGEWQKHLKTSMILTKHVERSYVVYCGDSQK